MSFCVSEVHRFRVFVFIFYVPFCKRLVVSVPWLEEVYMFLGYLTILFVRFLFLSQTSFPTHLLEVENFCASLSETLSFRLNC